MERIAILLEVAAFFMVTVELYGEARLEELHNRIREMCPKVQIRLERWHSRTVKFLNFSVSLKNFEVILLSVISLSCAAFALITHKSFHDLPSPLRCGLLIFILLVLIYELSQFYAGMFRNAIWLTGLVVWVLSCTLRRMKFKGLLLICGTTCFLLCKTIQLWIASGTEVSQENGQHHTPQELREASNANSSDTKHTPTPAN